MAGIKIFATTPQLRHVGRDPSRPVFADVGSKEKGTGTMAGPFHLLSAFGNDRRRRGFALADTVRLCRGRNAKESQRRCRQ